MKKFLICVLMLAVLLSGCARQAAPVEVTEAETMEAELERNIDIGLMDEYGVLRVELEDLDGSLISEDYNGIGVLGAAGEPMANCFEDYLSITPILEGDTFEGWMECAYDYDLCNYVIVSETLYSTEELMAMPVPEAPVEYVAKWAGIPVEEYFAMDMGDMIEDATTSGIFTFCGNGGMLEFQTFANEEYTCAGYAYYPEEGLALNDLMGTEYDDTLIGANKDGAEFTGWTLYMADDLFWSYEPVEEEDILCLVYDENSYNGVMYVLLRNAAVVGEDLPTEQLCGMTNYGENYLAMANWSE